MPYVKAGDLNTYYLERGEGVPVVLVHGNWGTLSWWEPTLERLPSGWRGIAYDVRGRGKTEGPDSGYTMPEMAADLRAFADALDIPSFHLVGHSLGSAIAMEFLIESPERVRSYTAVAPAWVDGMPEAYNIPASQVALKNDKAMFAQGLKALAPTAPDDDFWRRLVDEGHEQRMEAALRNLPALAAWKPGDAAGAVGVPALVISGVLDPLTGGDNAKRTAAALRARHVDLPGVGHSPIIEVPDLFVEMLVEHMTGAERRRIEATTVRA